MSLKKQNNFINKLAVSLLISCAFTCSVFAENNPDFSFISLSEPKPIRLERSATPLDASLIMNNENDFFTPPDSETSSLPDDEIGSITSSHNHLPLEGRTISTIRVLGLNKVKPEVALKQIHTKTGMHFNEELLQLDLQRIYASGYFTDDMTVEPTVKADGTVSLSFIVKENILVKDVTVFGNTVISTKEIMTYLKPLKGLPQNLNTINAAIENINELYHNKGYILASVDNVEDNNEGGLNFIILEGVINKIDIAGNERTKDFVLTRNIMTEKGTIYNEEYLKEDIVRLYDTRVFEKVEREITPTEGEKGAFDVVVRVKEKSTNSVALGGGIDTGLGAFGSLSLREDNFLGRRQRVSLSGILGSGILLSDASIKNHMNYQVELNFFEPHFINADNSLMGKVYYRELGSFSVPLAIERRFGVMTGVEHKVKGYKNLTTSLHGGIEHIHLKEGDFNKISELYAANNLDIAKRARQLQGGFFFNLTPGIKYSTLDNNEMPREGIIAQAQFMESISPSNFKRTSGRVGAAVTKFFPVFKKSTFSLTARGGIKVHGDEMPEVMAFRLGGPYSIRGFKMSAVGTGEAFVMGSAELATPIPFMDRFKWDIFKNMRIAFFVDAGHIFDPTISSTLYDRPLSAITAGVGIRINIPGVGPISVDYGVPFTNTGRYNSNGGYFTFGTGAMNMYSY